MAVEWLLWIALAIIAVAAIWLNRRLSAWRRTSTDGVGAAPRRQYYYRTAGCDARDAKDPDCTCWHDVGTGPWAKAEADDKRLEWRDAPAGVQEVDHGG